MPLWSYLTYEGTVEKFRTNQLQLLSLSFLGVILLLCNNGIKNNNKIIAHVAVIITLIAIDGLSKPLMSAIEEGRNLGVFRVSLMVLTSVIAMITFVKSFIEARKK